MVPPLTVAVAVPLFAPKHSTSLTLIIAVIWVGWIKVTEAGGAAQLFASNTVTEYNAESPGKPKPVTVWVEYTLFQLYIILQNL